MIAADIPAPCTAATNPFRTERLEALRFRLDEAGWRRLLDHGGRLGWRCALVGPEGTGKTTLLLELERRLASRFHSIRRIRAALHAPPSHDAVDQALSDVTAEDLVTVDGAEQFSPWRWWRLRRRVPGALLITSHRPGLLPTLHVHRSDAALLADLIRELTGTDADADAPRLLAQHDGNLRSCLLACYDRWAGR